MVKTNLPILPSLCYFAAIKLVLSAAIVSDPNARQGTDSGSVVQRFWIMDSPAQQNQMLRTHITCESNGINFTMHTAQPYTGTVSIPDKSDPCQKPINGETSFWFYVPSSGENKACTANVENNEIEAAIVLHNERPHCEMTERDVMYQARCPLTTNVADESFTTMAAVIHQVSEEVPKKTQEGRYAKLRILRGTEPVKQIFIGETVVLSIEADNDGRAPLSYQYFDPAHSAEGIFVDSCSVAPTNTSGMKVPVAIIKNGCSLMPNVVSDFRHIPDHLQATFTAFNINNTSALQFECVVTFCDDACPQVVCQNHTRTDFFRGNRVRRNNTEESRTLVTLYTRYNTSVFAVPKVEENAFATELQHPGKNFKHYASSTTCIAVNFPPGDQQSSTSVLWQIISITSFVLIFILVSVVFVLTRILIRKKY
ncbi:hypothetical protein D918_03474 [Trichuris suis]|nr:hypothetical protein D918_03474 [Trichuris suis]